jgi:uncharacterized protein YpmB
MKYQFVKNSEIALLIISAILIGGSAYFIGKIQNSESQSNAIQIVYPDAIAVTKNIINTPNQDQVEASINSVIETKSQIGKIIASKNGKRYYYESCTGVNRIKPENRIYFDTKEQAEAKGLTLASGCKAL